MNAISCAPGSTDGYGGGGDDPLWYALFTHPQKEDRAVAYLASKGYETFLPTCIVERRVHRKGNRRVEAVTVPLFPRYLFLRVGENQGLGAALDCWHVNNVVRGMARMPLPLPAAVINGLRTRCEQPLDLRPRTIADHFGLGDRVKVRDGAFSGFIGIVEHASKGRIRLALEMFGRPVTATLSPAMVDRA